jgi:ribosome biogenesis GTPase
MSLHTLGWNDYFQSCFDHIAGTDDKLEPARITCGYKEHYRISFGGGDALASVSGKFRYQATKTTDYPVVGDWVAASPDKSRKHAVIHFLLPRKTYFSRKAAGTGIEEQAISANIDTCFIVTDFGYDFNERRIERYLTLVYESGANPAIILNKSDLCEGTEAYVRRIQSIAFRVPVIVLSTLTVTGFDTLHSFLREGATASFLGSSGVGKSSIINSLAGKDLLKTMETRANGKGKHTTSNRELFVLDKKGIVIDNPGMRELQLWAGEDSAGETFADIEALSAHCRFRDCSHYHEPGCAVLEAVEHEELDRKRYSSFMKQKEELARLSKYTGLSKKEVLKRRKTDGQRLSKLIRKMKKEKK